MKFISLLLTKKLLINDLLFDKINTFIYNILEYKYSKYNDIFLKFNDENQSEDKVRLYFVTSEDLDYNSMIIKFRKIIKDYSNIEFDFKSWSKNFASINLSIENAASYDQRIKQTYVFYDMDEINKIDEKDKKKFLKKLRNNRYKLCYTIDGYEKSEKCIT